MQTETLRITVPIELAHRIRERIQNGEFASESDAFIESFRNSEADYQLSAEELEQDERWFQTELPEQLAALDNGSLKTYSLEEVRAHLKNQRHSRVEHS